MEEQKARKEVVTVQNNNVNDLVIGSDIQALIEYCKPIAKAGIGPYNTAEQVAAVYLYAHGKQINLMDALAHTAIINGRLSIDSHIARALLQRSGITFKILKNYSYIYAYRNKNVDITQEEIDNNPNNFIIAYNQEQGKAILADPNRDQKKLVVLRSEKPVDIETKILFRRTINNVIQEIISSFTWSEAETAGLTGKSNWKAYPKDCLFARCWTRGARQIADDIIFGCYFPEELGVNSVDFKVEDIQEEETIYEEVT